MNGPAPPTLNSAPARALPSVEKVLQALGPSPLPRPLIVDHVRQHLAALRHATDSPVPAFDTLLATLREHLAVLGRSRLQPVINATGILAHTNLGRAPLASGAVDALDAVARGYSNLEIDLESGDRGHRGAYLETALALACQAEAATVVNNCAAALVLILRHLARPPRNEVVISRGELVQIGGGFRIPDILESSGARLREIGTTNRTTLDDYRAALGPNTSLILKVHRSNFCMDGFVESPDTRAVAGLAREHHVPFVEDLGSGALINLADVAAIDHEPQPQEVLAAGADLVCFSGDKLLGGPQAGIIAGRTDLVRSLKQDPFFRALRCDKLVFAALQSTVESYLHAAARRDLGPPDDLPILAQMRLTPADLQIRAEHLVARLSRLGIPTTIAPGESRVGGGVCPRSHLPSVTLRIAPTHGTVDTLARRLRIGSPPVIGFIAQGHLHLDLRTVFPHQDDILVTAIQSASPGSKSEISNLKSQI